MNLPRGGEGARFGLGSSCSLDPPAQAATQRATWRGIWPAKKMVDFMRQWDFQVNAWVCRGRPWVSSQCFKKVSSQLAAWVGWRPQDLLNSVPQACGLHTELHEESVHERCGCTTSWATSKNLVFKSGKLADHPFLRHTWMVLQILRINCTSCSPLASWPVQFDADWIKDGKSGNSATATWLMILHVRPGWQASANLGST